MNRLSFALAAVALALVIPASAEATANCSTVVATPSVIQPSNRTKFVTVTLAGEGISLTITGVLQDEPVTAQGDETTPDAVSGSSSDQVLLRAERNPMGDGRVYQISFLGSDTSGETCSGATTVAVPRKKAEPAVDSGPLYNSFGP